MSHNLSSPKLTVIRILPHIQPLNMVSAILLIKRLALQPKSSTSAYKKSKEILICNLSELCKGLQTLPWIADLNTSGTAVFRLETATWANRDECALVSWAELLCVVNWRYVCKMHHLVGTVLHCWILCGFHICRMARFGRISGSMPIRSGRVGTTWSMTLMASRMLIFWYTSQSSPLWYTDFRISSLLR